MGKCLVCSKKLGAKQWYCSKACEQREVERHVKHVYTMQKKAGII